MLSGPGYLSDPSIDWVDNMSIHAATALIGWRTSSGSCNNYYVSLWKGMRIMSLLVFVLKSLYPKEDES
jgi:hypothetical protein